MIEEEKNRASKSFVIMFLVVIVSVKLPGWIEYEVPSIH